jgi:hypothetical protein
MNRRSAKRSPEFESLEVKELPSGAGIAVSPTLIHPHPAMAHRTPEASVSDVALNLSGTVAGTYRIVAGGNTASFTGRGTISPIGGGRLKGRIEFARPPVGGQFTIKFGGRGTVQAVVTGTTALGGYIYQIEGGTRTFKGDTGSGVAIVYVSPSNSAGTRGLFEMSLSGTSV